MRIVGAIVGALLLTVGVAGQSAATPTPWGPIADNPYLGPTGTATMHGDAASSDATPFAGPGTGNVSVSVYPLASACPTVLQGSDGLVVALCTAILGQTPTVHLIDPAVAGTGSSGGSTGSLGSLGSTGSLGSAPGSSGGSLASFPLAKGTLLGGVYAFVDNANRLVAVDGNGHLVRIGHSRAGNGEWQLTKDADTDLSSVIPAGDGVTGLTPGIDGTVWFATAGGVVGAVDAQGVAQTVALGTGEQVQNSISTSPAGRTAVATTHALYELAADASGRPHVLWRAAYDRGPARKPGMLSWGTGSTPTYFGPGNGAEYLTIVDNADKQVNALVFRSGSGEQVCSQPVLTKGGPGSENSPIGIGRTIVIASTYGYPYPTVPEGAGSSEPLVAPFTGGMTRVDVDDAGCHTVWENTVRSAAVPRLSTADGKIYTTTRVGPDLATPLDGFAYTVIDPGNGNVLTSQTLPSTIASDTLQMAPLLTPDRRMLQGTLTGILRITG